MTNPTTPPSPQQAVAEALKKAAEQALEALEHIANPAGFWPMAVATRRNDAIKALRAALATPPAPGAEPEGPDVVVVPREWRRVLRKLAFMARTSGGTPGPDSGLMAACAKAEALLAMPYLNATPQPVAKVSKAGDGYPQCDGEDSYE